MDTAHAWAAGFVDGEGCLVLRGNGLQIRVVQVDRRPLELLVEMYGGNIYEHGKARPGVSGQIRASWCWTACGVNAARALNAMRPYLQVKAEQVDLAMRFLAGEMDADTCRELLSEAKHSPRGELAEPPAPAPTLFAA